MLYTLCDLIYNKNIPETKEIIVDGDIRVDFKTLKHKIYLYRYTLRSNGIERGDRVGIYLKKSLDLIASLFAVWLNGGVAVIINEVLKKNQVEYILNHSQASMLITNDTALKNAGALSFEKDKILNIDREEFNNEYSERINIIGNDLALIIYTSGSTGMPKGVMLSHTNLLSGAIIVSDYLQLTKDDIIISLLPFSFDYGLNQLLTTILVGGKIVLQNSVFPADICNTILKENVTGMAGVPLLWQQLAQERSPFIKKNFPSLRYITNSGGRMPEYITRLFRRVHPNLKIYLMYGLTEAFRSTYLDPSKIDLKPNSIGKAIPNVEIMVLNEKGEICKPGEVGELVHRGACVSLGYWRDEKSTEERFKTISIPRYDGNYLEKVVFSGDSVKYDEDGDLYYIGRKDQMFKISGFRISPEEVEEYIFQSNQVSHAVVFTVPSEGVEDIIVAAVMPKSHQGFIENELLAYCKEVMPPYMVPGKIWVVNQIPQTTTGKPDRIKLKEMFLNSQAI
ncbi:MAG: Long-chain-fatty-acid--CoA ligase [Ignavibacteriae bacterium]|nr:MAG: Long-chain-fatty-acid--CoA ligase [Ignavibacteriota bacterium]